MPTDAEQDERYNRYQKMRALDRDMKAAVQEPPKDWIRVAEPIPNRKTQ